MWVEKREHKENKIFQIDIPVNSVLAFGLKDLDNFILSLSGVFFLEFVNIWRICSVHVSLPLTIEFAYLKIKTTIKFQWTIIEDVLCETLNLQSFICYQIAISITHCIKKNSKTLFTIGEIA